RDVAAVGGDRGVPAVVVPLRPRRVDARALGRAALPVADEDVVPPVGVPGHEVRGRALEGDAATVGGDRDALRAARVVGAAVAAPLRPGRADARALGRAELTVADEDIPESVRVAGHEVAGEAGERDVAAVGGDRGIPASVDPYHAAGVDARELGRA